METLTLLDTIIADWKLLVFAFGVGGFYWQGKAWFQKITTLLENSGRVHGNQNAALTSINEKLEVLDKRIARIEGSVEIITIDNQEQAIKIAVLETQTQIIDHPTKRRATRRQQT
jgi:hypothetical protein